MPSQSFFARLRAIAPALFLGVVLWLDGSSLGRTRAAEPPTVATTIEEAPDQAPAPPPATARKRVRHRTTARRNPGNERVEFGKEVHILSGEKIGQLVVIAGDAIVDGEVEGDVVVISGSARINGKVGQDLVTVLGSAHLGPEARVGQDAVVIGGPLRVSPQADIGGRRTVISFSHVLPDFTWLQGWLAKGLLLARPFPPQLKWVWGVAAALLLVYLAFVSLFPRPVRACVDALESQPVASFFVGLLLLVLLGPLLGILIVSVAGIVVIPFVLCALLAVGVLGKVAVYSYAGQQLGRQVHPGHLGLPGMLVIGALLFYLIYMVPVLGFAVWGVVTLLGLGAALLAAFGSLRRDTVPAPALAGAAAAPWNPASAAPMGGGTALLLAPPVISASELALLPRAGFWRRCCATALDFVLLCLLIPLTGPLFLLVWAAYHIVMWAWRGTTIGGIVLGLKVVRLDGQPLDFAVAVVRSLSAFFSAFALFLGFFWAGWDRERQSWHDKIAGTTIVKVPKGMSLI